MCCHSYCSAQLFIPDGLEVVAGEEQDLVGGHSVAQRHQVEAGKVAEGGEDDIGLKDIAPPWVVKSPVDFFQDSL